MHYHTTPDSFLSISLSKRGTVNVTNRNPKLKTYLENKVVRCYTE